MPRGAGRSHAKLLKFGIAYLKLLVRARREPFTAPVTHTT